MNDVGSHCMQLVVAYLFQARMIAPQTAVLSALQVVMNFIAGTAFDSTCLNFAGESRQNAAGGSTWAATLVHPVGKDADAVQFNCLWRTSASVVKALQVEAAIALRLLQIGSDTSFHRLFLEDAGCLARYDMVFTMTLVTTASSSSSTNGAYDDTDSGGNDDAEDEVAQLDMTLPQHVCAKVYSTAVKALANRAKVVSATIQRHHQQSVVGASGGLVPSSSSSSSLSLDIKASPHAQGDSWVVRLGVVLDADHAQRKVEKGPSPIDSATATLEATDATAVAAFRSFWGAKCELRRFKDGSIVDAVVWSQADVMQLPRFASSAASSSRELTGELVTELIVRYVLGRVMPRYAGPSGQSLAVVGSLDLSLPEATVAAGAAMKDPRKEQQHESKGRLTAAGLVSAKVKFLRAVESLDRLRGILTSDMKDLPLIFESVSGLSPELRYTSTLPPTPQPLLLKSKELVKPFLSGQPVSLLTQPMLLVGVVEGGGKWPEDVTAARKLKTAMMVRMASLLRKQFEVGKVLQLLKFGLLVCCSRSQMSAEYC